MWVGSKKRPKTAGFGVFIARAKHRKLRSSVFLCSPIPRDDRPAKGKKRPLKLTKGTIVVREPVTLRWSAVSEREKWNFRARFNLNTQFTTCSWLVQVTRKRRTFPLCFSLGDAKEVWKVRESQPQAQWRQRAAPRISAPKRWSNVSPWWRRFLLAQ